MKCKNCATEISTTTTDVVDHQLITCPACEAVFYAADNDTGIAPFTPSSRSLPAKMSIKVLNDELVITRHWREVVRLGLLAVVSFLLTFGLFFSDMPTAMFLFNPLTWIVAALGYYGLKGLVNTTVVWVSPIVIDRRGHIWVISSMESVSRFDGAAWTIYDQILEELNSVRTNTFGLWPVATLTIDPINIQQVIYVN